MKIITIVLPLLIIVSPNKADNNANQLANTKVTKEIYSFAPAADLNDDVIYPSDFPQTPVKKNYKVLFIRSPEYSQLIKALGNAATKNLSQKTVVYVLNKQTDPLELSRKFQNIKQMISNKPEVRFVNYRHKDEADEAVRSIQKHYNAQSGEIKNHQSEFAPVIKFRSNRKSKKSF